MLSFPRSRKWDCLDAAAYIVQMLEIGGRYFKQSKFYDRPDVTYQTIHDARQDELRMIYADRKMPDSLRPGRRRSGRSRICPRWR